MNINKKELIGLGIIGGFIATISYAVSMANKLDHVARKLDLTVEDLVDHAEIDIPDDVVDIAIDRAVERKVREYVAESCKKAIKEVDSEINSEIKKTVRDEFDRQKGSVKDELKKQISHLDIREIKDEVIREAKETAAEKFKKDLDDILDKHNDELESISRIYSSIADRLSGD